jgi:hypothetical protein
MTYRTVLALAEHNLPADVEATNAVRPCDTCRAIVLERDMGDHLTWHEQVVMEMYQ